jgi:hypothetical protein
VAVRQRILVEQEIGLSGTAFESSSGTPFVTPARCHCLTRTRIGKEMAAYRTRSPTERGFRRVIGHSEVCSSPSIARAAMVISVRLSRWLNTRWSGVPPHVRTPVQMNGEAALTTFCGRSSQSCTGRPWGSVGFRL